MQLCIHCKHMNKAKGLAAVCDIKSRKSTLVCLVTGEVVVTYSMRRLCVTRRTCELSGSPTCPDFAAL